MIRTAAVPRPIRASVAAASVLGIAVLAGCSAGAQGDAEKTATSAPAAPSATSTATPAEGTGSGAYADGTYTAEGSYQTPESVEKISVTLTLAGDEVTDVEVTGNPEKRESKQYQGQFIGGIREVVVGKKLDDVAVKHVAGSSLTSGGFMKALDEIKSEAAR